MQGHSWLRHYTTRQKVAGSICDGATGIFHWHNPSSCIMALGLTQTLTEMSSGNISWRVKAAGAEGWQPYHLHMPTVLKFQSGSLKLLEPSQPLQACDGIALPFTGYQQNRTDTHHSNFLLVVTKMVEQVAHSYSNKVRTRSSMRLNIDSLKRYHLCIDFVGNWNKHILHV